MARIRPQTGFETTLSSALTSSANTVALAVAPTETSGYMVVEPGTANKEIIKYTGVSGTTLTGVTRGLALVGSSDAAGSGTAHPAGVKCSMTNVHYYMEQLVDKNETENVGGIKKFTAKEVWIGDTTDTNETLYASNGDANKPYVQYNASTNKWLISNDGVSTYDITAGGSGLTAGANIQLNSSAIDSWNPVYGDGSDGAATLDGSTSYATWSSRSGDVYTMIRNAYLTDLTINSGKTLNTANFKLYVRGTLTNTAGTIQNNGGDGGVGGNGPVGLDDGVAGGTAGAAGAAVAAGWFPAAKAGVVGVAGGTGFGGDGPGGNGINGTTGTAGAVSSLGGNGVAGGAGGFGGGHVGLGYANSTPGTAGAAGTDSTAAISKPRNPAEASYFLDGALATFTKYSTGASGGSGGSGGGGSGFGSGGGGGGGGSGGSGATASVLLIAGWKIVNTGSILCKGGAGGAGGNGGNARQSGSDGGGGGSGGGGAGGNGGVMILIYGILTDSGTISVAGGAAGAAGAVAGAKFGVGTAGAVGAAGTAGTAGTRIDITD